MTKIVLLEPSFENAIVAIRKAEELPASRRTHWVCSLRQIAKWLDRPLANLAARWGAVALKSNQLHHANLRVEWKTLANHRANAKAALQWFCDEDDGVPRRGSPIGSAWGRLRSQISNLSRRAKLSGLIRYCGIKGIEPDQVTEAVVDAYMLYRAQTTALATGPKARRRIARAWNVCVDDINCWPETKLVVPPLKAKEWPLWEHFPESLREDVDWYLESITKRRRSPRGKRLAACKPSTVRTRRVELIGFAKKAVRLGVPIATLTSLAVLLDPAIVERVVEQEWEQNGADPKISTIDRVKKLYGVARSIGLDKEPLDKLDDMRAELEHYRPSGLTPKNLDLVRKVLNDEVWGRVVNSPEVLMRKARSLLRQAPVKAAVTAQIAIGIAILSSVAPLRISNLATLKLGENLTKPAGPEGTYLLTIPKYDVKNKVDLTFEIDEEITALIDEYIHDFRPAVMRGSNEDWLFPGEDGGPKGTHWFGRQLSERIEKTTGLRITPHQFRHAAAAVYLKHNPGHYVTVQQLLGHRSVRTTQQFYCGLETIHATRQFGNLIRNQLRSKDDEPRGLVP